ncbi:MAG TPA: GAF domain-containing sensor histidine kinase [Chloroflexota bacterium]|nr:GAF domain-containing sensor histidine kinase [Chloroflexota bacterium]
METDTLGPEVGALLDAARDLASTLELHPLLELLLDHLGMVVNYSGTAILVLDPAGECLTFAHMRGPASFTWEEARRIHYAVNDFRAYWDRLSQDEPIIIADVRGESAEAATFRRLIGEDELDTTYAFIRSAMWVPLVVRGRIIGLLSITNPAPHAYGPRDAALALAIARQAAVAMENARLHERARQAAVLEERQRLARELHDSVSQALYGVSLYAEAAGRALADGETAPAAAHLREIRETVQEALGEMRLLLFELRPPLLEEHGLAGALEARLRAVEARAGLVTEFHGEHAARLPPETEQELYRLAQEALNNVLRHAQATRVTVWLDVAPDGATLEIVDDGVGFEPARGCSGGFGLRGMSERAERLGGTLAVESAPGAGTRVRVEVP